MPPRKKKQELILDYSAINNEKIDTFLEMLWEMPGFLDWVKQRDFALLRTLGTLLAPEQYHLYIGRRAELLQLALDAKKRFEEKKEDRRKKVTELKMA